MFTIILWIHILFGSIALITAPCAMMMKKGEAWHRFFGKQYYLAMIWVTLSAVFLAIHHHDPFLFFIAIFSYYFVFSGKRSIHFKMPNHRASPIDWIAGLIAFMCAFGLLGYGIYQYFFGINGFFAIIFGLIAIRFSWQDITKFGYGNYQPKAWFFFHIQKMVSAYIATVTAFSIVNFSFLPPTLRWLWPAAIGILAILSWTRYYQRKFNYLAKSPA